MKPIRIFKLLLVGDKNIGRRTLLKEALKDVEYFNEDYSLTTGVEFYKKIVTLEDQIVYLQVWRVTSGWQFKMRPKHLVFGSNVAILMFDLTNVKSLEYLAEVPQMIRQHAGEIPIMLVGNKSDLAEERTISIDQGTIFAKNNDLLEYNEISAKTGENCERVFEILANAAIANLL